MQFSSTQGLKYLAFAWEVMVCITKNKEGIFFSEENAVFSFKIK